MVRYVLITGGVISGVGKGVIASSTGLLLRKVGYKVTAIKIDPYLNIDAGTMSPFEHGEVFILDDGGEVDLDLGNYERFMDVTLSKENNITTGKIYQRVIQREREGYYLGKTVQVVPHICDTIQEWIEDVAKRPTSNSPPSSPRNGTEPDICIIELGGTIGDIESMPFVEAMRQFQFRVGKENFIEMHVSLVPVVGSHGEQKTKPTQSSVRELRSLGLSPDIIICRSNSPLEEEVSKKIAQFCHVPQSHVVAVHNVSNLYHVPLLLNQQQLCEKILKHFQLPPPSPSVDEQIVSWKNLAEKMDSLLNSQEAAVKIAMVGKYTGLSDSYLSVIKSVTHSSLELSLKTELVWIESTDLENTNDKESYQVAWSKLRSADGIIVPGGFGNRGVEGMISCCKYARENKVPFFGICLGFQVAVIEICRSVLGWSDANSEEFDPNAANKAIIFMPEGSRTVMGGTMRLGSRTSIFSDVSCQAFQLYGSESIEERHRHRYEVNPELVKTIESTGLKFVAQDETKERMEIFEIKEGHPYYLGTQAHPEMKSRPGKPSPLFLGLVRAAGEYHKLQEAAKKN